MRVLDLLPRRTMLLPVEPVDPELSKREALTSYFRRLCAANGLRVSRVFNALILPCLSDINVSGKRRNCLAYHYRLINGSGKPASEWVTALEEFTGTKGLRQLTFLEWGGTTTQPVILPERCRKWCPACYEDALDRGSPVYDQLAWTIRGFDCCPEHDVFLEKICPHCHKGPFQILTGHDVAGFCPYCSKWLGTSASEHHGQLRPGSDYSLWMARSILTIMERNETQGVMLSYPYSRTISKLIDQHFEGSAVEFGKWLGRPKSVIYGWRQRDVFPSWEAWHQLSYCFSIPLRELITGDIDAPTLSPPRTLPQPRVSARRKPKRRRWEKIGRFLRSVLQEKEPGFDSLTAVARRLQVSSRCLRRQFPKECAALSKRLAAQRQREFALVREKSRLALMTAICEAIDLLCSHGRNLTRRNIERVLSTRKIKLGRHNFHLIKQCLQHLEAESQKPAKKAMLHRLQQDQNCS
jgi:hypothetical protein